MPSIEVDQSGKMGDLAVHTVLALANDIEYTILIPARVKRAIIQELRAWGKSKIRAVLQVFAAGLFLLVRDSLSEVEQIVIDIEYTGYDMDVRSMLLNHIWRVDPTFDKERLVFRRIGKKSPAHKRALATYQGKQTNQGTGAKGRTGQITNKKGPGELTPKTRLVPGGVPGRLRATRSTIILPQNIRVVKSLFDQEADNQCRAF